MRIYWAWAISLNLIFASAISASAEPLSESFKLKLEATITGDISPKSVRSSNTGFVSAHNMMYSHSVTIYDARNLELVKSISDQVNLKDLGIKGYSGLHRGAPVEGAFSPDGKHLYVTNYAMYGKGFNREGTDAFDLSTNKVVKSVKTGSAARSLDISADGSALYVVNYTSNTLAKVRVSDFKVLQKINVCSRPIGVTYEKLQQRVWVACYGGSIKVFSDSQSQ
ncbi:MAG: hypothetical protein EB014_03785 [Actinobacteria bacterium]|nr:hypothetical protein [Actinomycetota bacterium]